MFDWNKITFNKIWLVTVLLKYIKLPYIDNNIPWYKLMLIGLTYYSFIGFKKLLDNKVIRIILIILLIYIILRIF